MIRNLLPTRSYDQILFFDQFFFTCLKGSMRLVSRVISGLGCMMQRTPHVPPNLWYLCRSFFERNRNTLHYILGSFWGPLFSYKSSPQPLWILYGGDRRRKWRSAPSGFQTFWFPFKHLEHISKYSYHSLYIIYLECRFGWYALKIWKLHLESSLCWE